MKETIDLNSGYSIELDLTNDWNLILRGEHKGLPLYESVGGKISAVAIVQKPAIQQNDVGVEKERLIIGPVMIPDLKIYRNQGPVGPEKCYWYFTAETIEKLVKTFDGKIKIGH